MVISPNNNNNSLARHNSGPSMGVRGMVYKVTINHRRVSHSLHFGLDIWNRTLFGMGDRRCTVTASAVRPNHTSRLHVRTLRRLYFRFCRLIKKESWKKMRHFSDASIDNMAKSRCSTKYTFKFKHIVRSTTPHYLDSEITVVVPNTAEYEQKKIKTLRF